MYPNAPGFALGGDAWVQEYEGCKTLAQETVQLIQVRALPRCRFWPKQQCELRTGSRLDYDGLDLTKLCFL